MNYKVLTISDENKNKEQEVIKSVFSNVINNQSFIYDTGAGAGKTYVLIETLLYIIKTKGELLKLHNQKVMCITYTNVAVDEIKNRLGNSNLVVVSTIHERMWDIIGRHQKELIKLHEDKLKEAIFSCNNYLEANSNSQWYRNIEDKDKFSAIINNNLKEYYKYYNKSSNVFRSLFLNNYLTDYSITNVSHFKEAINKLISLYKYKRALYKIENNESVKIKYDARFNNDKLDKFMISHDTLLEYSEKLICNNNLLRKIILNKFPYIFIDEYQDTSENVVSLINSIKEKSEEDNMPICVGFFGDIKQNIYESGVGMKFYRICKNYKIIQNNYNRRSMVQVINIANKIRNDEIKQETIYEDFERADIVLKNELNDRLIEEIKNKWNININNKLYCLFLKNEIIAEKNGFKELYDAFKPYYSGARYEQLGTELLSDDEKKLGEIQLIFKRIMEFRHNLENKNGLVNNYLDIKNNSLSIREIKDQLDKFNSISGNTIIDYLKDFYNIINNDKQIKYILSSDLTNFEMFKNIIKEKLIKDDDVDVEFFLNIQISTLESWYKFVTREFEDKDVVYQTIHSSKGLQFDNVLIELGDNFAKDGKYFKRFFENYNSIEKCDNIDKYEKAQNLLYVGVTRAVENLAICYDLHGLSENGKYNYNNIFNQ